MNLSELSIHRPVLATVFVLMIILFGVIGYTSLPVREYPNVDNPIITVTVSYPGANAEVIENQITEPLEQNINGIPGIRSLTSQSSQGRSRITVEFELSVDMETAANDVRDKVSVAQRYLPRDADPPTVSKADADSEPIMQITIESPTRSLLELSEIADLTVKERLQTISNVSAVEIWGENRYSMRLWLDPEEDGSLWSYPRRCQKCTRSRKYRTSGRKHRRRSDRAVDPNDGVIAITRRFQ